MLVTFDEFRDRNTFGYQLLSIKLRSFKKFSEILVVRVLIITELSSLCNLRTIVNDNVKEGIKKQNYVERYGAYVQEYWDWGSIK